MKKRLLISSILALSFLSSAAPVNACGWFPFLRFRPRAVSYYQYQAPAQCATGTCSTGSCSVPEEYAPRPNQEIAAVELRDLDDSSINLMKLINNCRARYGLQSLRPDRRLFDGAALQAQRDSARGFLCHEGACEILAQNYRGFEEAIKQWLSSPAHRALLLNGSYTRCGASFHKDAYGRVWCAVRFQ